MHWFFGLGDHKSHFSFVYKDWCGHMTYQNTVVLLKYRNAHKKIQEYLWKTPIEETNTLFN